MNNFETVEISSAEKPSITFFYNTLPGRLLLKILIRPFISVFFGFLTDRRFSAIFIRRFIKRNNINIDDYENENYRSFNDFFSRKIKDGYRGDYVNE